MCSVVEIKTDKEFYIHYHSPESMESSEEVNEEEEEIHPLFKRTSNLDSSSDKDLSDISEHDEEANLVLVSENKREVEKPKLSATIDLPIMGSNDDLEDKGSGYNFGKKWSYFNGNLLILI